MVDVVLYFDSVKESLDYVKQFEGTHMLRGVISPKQSAMNDFECTPGIA